MDEISKKGLNVEEKMMFSGDESTLPANTLTVITYEDADCKKPVIIFEKGKGVLNPVKGLCKAFIITEAKKENSIDPLNPHCGELLVNLYFSEFERRCPDVKPGTLNYFFQDELMFGTDTRYLWVPRSLCKFSRILARLLLWLSMSA